MSKFCIKIKVMKNYIFLLLLSLITLNSFAQVFQGKAFYISKTKMDPNFGKNMPPERKQRIMERLKSNLEKNYALNS